MSYDYIAIVPARQNSRTIPHKNMRLLDNKPLLSYTFDFCKKYDLETYLLTDSDEYQEYAKKQYGFDSIEESLIDSNTIMDMNLLPYLYPRFKDKHIILLQPTSPIRQFNIFDRCIDQYDGNSLITCETIGSWTYVNKITPLFDRFHRPLKDDPDYKKYYFFDGNILIRNLNEWEREKCIVSENPVMVENSKLNSAQIDYKYEMDEVEQVLKLINRYGKELV